MSKIIQLNDSNGNEVYPICSKTYYNDLGEYIKFANGTLICYNRINVYIDFNEQLEGKLYRGKTNTPIEFPHKFSDYPTVIVSTTTSDLTVPYIQELCVRTQTEISYIQGLHYGSGGNIRVPLQFFAIGHWK